uniref:p46 n=1 Tax=Rice tungro bacilliform virus TaxID=10654 RepID=Q9WQX9_9VIRU|nr:P46 [Rice tungro bacilliform virus]
MNIEYPYSIHIIDKNKVPIYDQGNLFHTEKSARLSHVSRGLLDHLFTFSSDNTERVRKLHILADYLYLLESERESYKNEWISLKDQVSLLQKQNSELRARIATNKEIIEGLREPVKKPIYTTQDKERLRVFFCEERSMEYIYYHIKRLAQQSYYSHLNKLQKDCEPFRGVYMSFLTNVKFLVLCEAGYWTVPDIETNTTESILSLSQKKGEDLLQKGVVIFNELEGGYQLSPRFIGDLYAHGFIKQINFTTKVPEGLPPIIAEKLQDYKFPGSNTVLIEREIPRWNFNEMKRETQMRTNLYIFKNYRCFYGYSPLRPYEPITPEEFGFDYYSWENMVDEDEGEVVYISKTTKIIKVTREHAWAWPEHDGDTMSCTTSIEYEWIHRMDNA